MLYVRFTSHSDMLGTDNAPMSGLAQSFWPWFSGCIKECRAEKKQHELFFDSKIIQNDSPI